MTGQWKPQALINASEKQPEQNITMIKSNRQSGSSGLQIWWAEALWATLGHLSLTVPTVSCPISSLFGCPAVQWLWSGLKHPLAPEEGLEESLEDWWGGIRPSTTLASCRLVPGCMTGLISHPASVRPGLWILPELWLLMPWIIDAISCKTEYCCVHSLWQVCSFRQRHCPYFWAMGKVLPAFTA